MRLQLHNVAVVSFFLLYFIVGVSIYRDYGISWDENISRKNGILTYEYITRGSRGLFTNVDRYHGAAFELVLVAAEKITGVTTSQAIFFQRHFLTFFLFYISTIAFYVFLRMQQYSSPVSLAGVGMLVLSPRIFADSFYNSKDLAFLSAFLIAATTGMFLLKKPSIKRVFVHAAACAFAIDIRVLGILVPLFTFALFAMRIIKDGFPKRDVVTFVAGFVSLLGFTVLFWPVLWEHPLRRFIDALEEMKRFPWNGDVLYLGSYIKASELPWHYIPVWIVVTTPIAYLLFFAIGGISGVKGLIKRDSSAKHFHFISLLAWIAAPLVVVVVLRSRVYDGWRHLFFVYPAIIALAARGLKTVVSWVRSGSGWRRGMGVFLFVIAGANVIVVLSFMVRNHPYQNVYFNAFAGGMTRAKQTFELDYWGLSFREGFEYILRTDPSSRIQIAVVNGGPGATAILGSDGARMTQVKDAKLADYILSTYRGHKDEYSLGFPEYYSRSVDGAKILIVYRRPD